MPYAIPTDVEATIDALLATGRFASADEVLRKAFVVLAERDAFVAEVSASFDELEAGGGVSLNDYEAELHERRAARHGQ
ncbi:MAG: type II toxin-antitoxin system ParD family antitoxin [Pirellulales bacterium]